SCTNSGEKNSSGFHALLGSVALPEGLVGPLKLALYRTKLRMLPRDDVCASRRMQASCVGRDATRFVGARASSEVRNGAPGKRRFIGPGGTRQEPRRRPTRSETSSSARDATARRATKSPRSPLGRAAFPWAPRSIDPSRRDG